MSKKSAVILSSMKSVLAEFGNYYATELSKEYVDLEQRPDRLRVSSFPFCGLESAYKLMVKDETVRKAGFGSKYYTGVGTLTHEIIQDMVGMGGRIIGQWNCLTPNCKGVRLLSRKNKCPICKGLMRYEELTVSAFKYVSGHLDGIYKTKDGEYFVVDYKTSSVRVIESQHERRTLPYHHNVCQIRAYCALVELMFDIKISGWILHYLARDSPMTIHRSEGKRISTEQKAAQLKLIEQYDRHWGIRSNMKKYKHLQILIDEKPCATAEDYKKNFDSFTPCPLSQGGLCFQEKALTNHLRIVWSDYAQKL